MSNEQKSLVDQILHKLRNNPLMATLIVASMGLIGIAAALGALEDIYEKCYKWFGICKVEVVCTADQNFAVKLFFADGRREIKDKIKQQLDDYGYFDSSHNTDFSEFENPGKPQTARVIYPKCITRQDERMKKVIEILEREGFREDENLKVFPSKGDNFQNVQISVF
ncbi:MAG: hypothetical protein AB4041_14990 [Microcystaceae cyanobacterium]